MRTTLDLDEDVALAARRIARERGHSVGRVVSDLARKGLASSRTRVTRNGVPLLTPKPGAPVPDMGLVNELRDA